MCYFLTIAVPVKAARQVLELAPDGVRVVSEANPDVLRRLGDRYRASVILSGGCSCGLYRGPKKVVPEHRRRKYRKLGWSAAKISRAIESAGTSGHAFNGLRQDVRGMVERAVGEYGEAVLLLHWYHGNQRTSAVAPRDGPGLAVRSLRDPCWRLAEDELTRVKLQNPPEPA